MTLSALCCDWLINWNFKTWQKLIMASQIKFSPKQKRRKKEKRRYHWLLNKGNRPGQNWREEWRKRKKRRKRQKIWVFAFFFPFSLFLTRNEQPKTIFHQRHLVQPLFFFFFLPLLFLFVFSCVTFSRFCTPGKNGRPLCVRTFANAIKNTHTQTCR